MSRATPAGSTTNSALPPAIPGAMPPEALTSANRWVHWAIGPGPDGSPTKLPFCVGTGELASVTKPSDWASYREAADALADPHTGLGIVLGDGLAGVDLDVCRDPASGDVAPWAWKIIRSLNSYTEVSPSLTGVKIFLKGDLPPGRRVLKAEREDRDRGPAIEMYDMGRYFTVTRMHLPGTPLTVEDRTEQLHEMHRTLFPPAARSGKRRPEEGAARPPSLPDDEVLTAIGRSRQAMKFAALLKGDTADYPSPSEADLAFCSIARFWTGGDRAQVERLYRQSGLMREKWDQRRGAQTYGELTLDKAMAGLTYERRPPIGSNGKAPHGDGDAPPTGAGGDAGAAETPGERSRTSFTDAELDGMEVEPAQQIVKGLLTEGAALLGGKPKTGKTLLALGAAVAVTSDGVALGERAVIPGSCLYLALEDRPHRLKDRLRKIRAGTKPSGRLYIELAWPTLAAGGLPALREWLDAHRDCKLVVIDTYGKFRGRRHPNADSYMEDYEAIGALNRVGQEYGCCILILHHLRKLPAEDDPFDAFSGTLGLNGGAATLLVMKKGRCENKAVLWCTGWDIEDDEIGLAFEPQSLSWTIGGDPSEIQLTPERRVIWNALKEAGQALSPAEVAKRLQQDRETVKQRLWQMAEGGHLIREEGRYRLPAKSHNHPNPPNPPNHHNHPNRNEMALDYSPPEPGTAGAAPATSEPSNGSVTMVTEVTPVTAVRTVTTNGEKAVPRCCYCGEDAESVVLVPDQSGGAAVRCLDQPICNNRLALAEIGARKSYAES